MESLCVSVPGRAGEGRRGEQRASSSTRHTVPSCPLPLAAGEASPPRPGLWLCACRPGGGHWRRRLGRRSPRLPAKDSFYYFHDPRPLYLSLIFKTPINRENGANDAVRTQPEPCGAGPALESPHETRDTPAPAERCALLRGVSAGLPTRPASPPAPAPPECSVPNHGSVLTSSSACTVGRQNLGPGMAPGSSPRYQAPGGAEIAAGGSRLTGPRV